MSSSLGSWTYIWENLGTWSVVGFMNPIYMHGTPLTEKYGFQSEFVVLFFAMKESQARDFLVAGSFFKTLFL